ncbi:SAM-dependent methyltransferase, partial [Haloplanus ruber]
AGADPVVSDMAPNMTGEYSVDHARSIHLARQALGVAEDVLAPGGDLVVKAFDGPDLAALRTDMDDSFEYVRSIRPDASRDSSSEVYLVAKGYLTAPITAGDELVVDVVDRGDEGDGIARVDGFTVFVPDAEVGDRVEVRIDEVKPRFAFAERV